MGTHQTHSNVYFSPKSGIDKKEDTLILISKRVIFLIRKELKIRPEEGEE